MFNFINELTIGGAIIAGLVAGLSPCTLPTAALVVGYVGGSRENSRLKCFLLSLFFVLGLSLTLATLGLAVSSLGSLIQEMTYMNKAIGALMIVLGLIVIDIIPLNIGLKQGVLSKFTYGGFLGAFFLGIPFAFIASPCTIPITTAVLALAATKADLVFGFWFLLIYALGRSVPLLLVGTFTGILKSFSKSQAFLYKIQKFSGILLLGLGLYFIIFI